MTAMQPNKSQRDEYISRINRVLDYIDRHLDQPLSLATLAREANFSPYHFHRIFSALMGETLNQFIQRVRLEKAAIQLIHDPGKSVTAIAMDHGYASPAAFARAFISPVRTAHFFVFRFWFKRTKNCMLKWRESSSVA